MNNKKFRTPTKVKVILVIVALFLLGLIVKHFVSNFNDTKYTITITDKDRTHSGNEKYLVFGEDSDGNVRVFENSDTWLRWKWDSSDLQGKLKIGNTYEVTVVGYRVPLFSWYENIISIKEVT